MNQNRPSRRRRTLEGMAFGGTDLFGLLERRIGLRLQEFERTAIKGKMYGLGLSRLPRKKDDFLNYWAPAHLTEKQANCFSLRYEYRLTITEIASRFKIDRSTVRKHIALAKKKIVK